MQARMRAQIVTLNPSEVIVARHPRAKALIKLDKTKERKHEFTIKAACLMAVLWLLEPHRCPERLLSRVP